MVKSTQQPRTDTHRGPHSRNSEIVRRFAIRAVITGVLAVAVWYMGIRPIERSLATERADLDRQIAELNADAASEASLTDAKARVTLLRGRVLSLAGWTERAGARSNAYDAFRQIAAAASVRIIRIEPKGQFVLSPQRGSKDPVGEVFGHGVHVTGGFQEIAHFLDRLETDLGSSRVLSFRLAPTRGPASVEASIDTSHVALNTGTLRRLAAEAGSSVTVPTEVGR